MNEAGTFDELISEFYKVWFRYHPVAAIFAGVSGYEGLLEADGDDDIGALGSWLSNLLVSLEELDYAALDPDRQLDLQLLFGAAMVEHRTLLECDWRHRDPAKYLPLRALQELVVRQPDRFCEAIQGLLERTGNYLRDARGQLSELPELISTMWLADALEATEAGVPWLKRLGRELPQTNECCTDQGQLQSLSSEAAQAIEDFREYLINEIAPVASGSSDCGPELAGRLIKHRHHLDLTGEDALYMARMIQAQIQQQVEAAGLNVEHIVKRMANEPLLAGEARVQAYREEAERLRRFVEEENILHPPDQELDFRLTCHCFTKCECGSYLRSKAGGVFLVPDESQIGGGESLASIRLRSLYGGWAGRHFLAWAGGIEAHSLVRQINQSAAFKRGWAHYMSHLLEDRGYFCSEDMLQLAQRRLALAEQAVVDLEYHMGLISSMQALERLQAISDVPGWAESSLTSVSRRPTDAFMALIGASMMDTSRRLVLQAKPELSLQAFHSEILAHGAVALPLVIKRVYGEAIWQQVTDEVLVI
ncbi:MAG: DUF885 family protein [Gammaproteobacteria bacterium]|nr:DUF885 family protein [Gammaproteobacteria bacterium]